jgi:t-SNARE complex subunit (syntaxin)
LVEPEGKHQQFMQEFLGDVEVVKANIHVIREATRRIADINQRVVLASSNEKELDESNDLGPVIKATNQKASLAKKLLQALRESTEQIRKTGASSSANNKQSELRIRDNLLNTLTRKFVDVMKEYQSAQIKYKTDIKKKVKRHVQIVKPDATSEEIDAVLRSGNGTGELFKTAILKGEAADTIRNAYMNVAEKYQDVLALEASVAELHQMFLDFALLTEQQGELLDQIEHQVKEACDHIESGNVQLEEAIELQKSIRRKQCCCIMIVALVIIIIVGIILASVGAKGGL